MPRSSDKKRNFSLGYPFGKFNGFSPPKIRFCLPYNMVEILCGIPHSKNVVECWIYVCLVISHCSFFALVLSTPLLIIFIKWQPFFRTSVLGIFVKIDLSWSVVYVATKRLVKTVGFVGTWSPTKRWSCKMWTSRSSANQTFAAYSLVLFRAALLHLFLIPY